MKRLLTSLVCVPLATSTPLCGAAACLLVSCGHDMDHGGHADPRTVAIAPIEHDALFVVNGGSNSISVIDTDADAWVGDIRIENATYPHHIGLSPDGTELAVAFPGSDLSGGHTGHGDAGAGALLRLEARTGATLAARRLDAPNHNGLFSADGSEIWTSQMTSPGTVLVLDAATLADRRAVTVGDMPAEVTRPSGNERIFATNTLSDDVTVIDASSKQVVDTVAVGAAPVGAWPGNDGLMYVDNEEGRSISAIDADSLAVVRTYELGFTPGMAATAPDGALWVSDATNGRVVFYAAGGTTVDGEVATGAGAHAIVFSADGAKAYVSNQAANTVSVIDVSTRTVSSTLDVGSKPNGMVFRAH